MSGFLATKIFNGVFMNIKLKNLFGVVTGFIMLLTASSGYAYEAESDPNSDKDEGAKVKLSGTFDFRSAFGNQNHLKGDEKNLSPYKKKFVFNTTAAIFVGATYRLNDVNYGARITLVPTTKTSGSASYNGSHIYVSTDDFGRVEIGSAHDASGTMRLTACEIGAATCDGWSSFAKLDADYMKYQGLEPEFASAYDYFLGGIIDPKLSQINDGTEQARKITFYTPVMQGFQVGVSYVPDTANNGIGKFNKSSNEPEAVKLETGHTLLVNNNVRDVVTGAISYERNISDGIDFKVAVSGEYGKPSKMAVEDNKGIVTKHKLSNLRTYNIGGFLNYGSFSYAASYGSLNKSLTNKYINKAGRDTIYYDAAVAYGQGPVKASLTYFKSAQFKNTIDAFTLGSEYAIASGLTPYAEITYFQAKGRPSFYLEADKKKTKGTIAIIGAKLKF